MPFDFDRIINRRSTHSIKWDQYDQDVLPLWVADMDFRAPEPILEALHRRVDHGVFGYEILPRELKETVVSRMEKLYNWQVDPEAVLVTPGVVAGFNLAARAACEPGEGILVQPPVYPPFLSVAEFTGMVRQDAPLVRVDDGQRLHYEIDFDIFKAAVDSGGARTGMFLLCQPHNPIGQIYDRAQLTRMADLCLERNIVICSDEIHSELLLDGAQHLPMASLSPEIARRSITLVAPSKTYNIPGLFAGFAIIPDAGLRERYRKVIEQVGAHVSSLGIYAAQVAYSGACDDWLAALRLYLTANRNTLLDFVAANFPEVGMTVPQATYLAWLDCTRLVESGRITGTPYEYFLKQARVALNDGATFGQGGQGFVRLNFGCPRSALMEALERMQGTLR